MGVPEPDHTLEAGSAKLRLPLGHIESGLRSFDRGMPEEINRIVADEFAEMLFLHSDEAAANLRAEGSTKHECISSGIR